MAHPNEDLIRRGYEAFGAADMATLGELFADDIKWHVPGNNPLAGDLEGKDAVFQNFARIAEMTGGTFRLEIHDVLANDEHGIALVRTSGQREGKSLTDNAVHVLHIQGGKVVEFWNHPGDQAAVDEFLS
jgi:uncharacterized protein